MPPKAKRPSYPGGGGGGPSKKQRVLFKMREISVPGASNASSSAQPVQLDTRSYQIYDLADGRLGMRQEDAKVSVDAPAAQTQPNSGSADTVTPEVLGILGEYPADECELPGVAPTQVKPGKKKRKRVDLRAAVSTVRYANVSSRGSLQLTITLRLR